MNTKRIAAVVLAIALAVCLGACAEKKEEASTHEAKTGGIAWMKFDEGMAMAKKEGKPVMVDFFSPMCMACNMLDGSTYKDNEIISILNGDFVPVKVNIMSADTVEVDGKQMSMRDLAISYKVDALPTLIFFSPSGNIIRQDIGFSPPEQFKPALTYITSGAYKKGIEYEYYVKSLPPPQAAAQETK